MSRHPVSSWTPAEDAILLLIWPSVMSIADVVTQVGRSVHAIRHRAQILKVRRPHQKAGARPAGPFWRVPGRFELALEMAHAGHPMKAIAEKLGCTTNMVIGKLNRSRLYEGHPHPPPGPKWRPKLSEGLAERLARYPEPKGCRYITGDPRGEWHWCDAEPWAAYQSYCPPHHNACWRREAES